MKLLIIAGNAATGKMTVGQELTKITNLKLMHNHIMIEPVLEIFGGFDINIINRLREVVFDEFSKLDEYGIIFTCMVNFDNTFIFDWLDYITEIMEQNLAENNDKLERFFIELDCDIQTRIERNKTENRLLHKPSKRNIEISEKRLLQHDQQGRYVSFENEVQELGFENYLRIVNDNISAANQAQLIKKYFDL
jgi:tRNA uridine 5-carbamoylmethylation protein Kti12